MAIFRTYNWGAMSLTWISILFTSSSICLAQSLPNVPSLNVSPAKFSYVVEYKVLLSPKLHEADVEAAASAVAAEWQKAKLSNEEIASGLAQFKSNELIRSKNWEVTFASRENWIFYSAFRTDSPESNIEDVTLLYDGEKTYRQQGDTLHISDSQKVRSVQFFPMFGIQYLGTRPYSEVTDPGFYTKNNLPDSGIKANVYWPSPKDNAFSGQVPGYVQFAKLDGLEYPTKLFAYDLNAPIKTIEFDDFDRSVSPALAKKVVYISYRVDPTTGKMSKTPLSQTVFRLKSFSTGTFNYSPTDFVKSMRFRDPVVVELKGQPKRVITFNKENSEIIELLKLNKSSNFAALRIILTFMTVITVYFVVRAIWSRKLF